MSVSERSQIEARLMETLQDAKAKYESTKQQFEVAMQRTGDGLGLSNGHPSIQHVEQAHNEAIRKYSLALMNFDQFIVNGELNNGESKPGPFVCDERTRLLNAYSSATLALSASVDELIQNTGTNLKAEYMRLNNATDRARIAAEQAHLNLEKHIA